MVRWSIFNVPLQRRLQTLSLLYYAISGPLFGIPLILIISALLFPFIWPVYIPYLIWYIFYDKAPSRGGRVIQWVRGMRVWGWFRAYFPINLIKTSELPVGEGKRYLFAYHPHGIISLGAFANFLTKQSGFDKLYPGLDLRVATLKGNFNWPIYREYLLAMGLVDVSQESIVYNLTRKVSFKKGEHSKPQPGSPGILVVIGGAQEALDAHPGTNDVTLRNRKGFVRVALTQGACLVPVYSFGENNVFNQVNNAEGTKLRYWQNRLKALFGFSLPLFSGRGIFNYDFGILPHRQAITSVVGAAIELPLIEKPTREDVDKWHAKYVEALTDLYDRYKDVYDADRKSELRIK
eukprot:TRINITY_DN6681_c0_g1_i1.p1 TRINITY_DN6681_c0_g1~~TRINITY_DN6681_c0_g1_i1.p1  ORF type:complete len:349 (+),score=53.70 TRINITY_DN6681_c0_g1_i1:1204-2250(+)